MIVLGMSVALMASLTLLALSLLVNIQWKGQRAPVRIF